MNNLTAEIKLTIDQVKQWCEDNGYVIHSAYKMTSDNLLTSEKVKNIAAQINGVDVELLSTNNRDKEVVWARWLVFYYFDKLSKLSLAKIGMMCNRDHSTVINAIAGVTNPYINGWRKTNKEKFEHDIDKMHDGIGLKAAFNRAENDTINESEMKP